MKKKVDMVREKVLIVDDEPSVLDLSAKVLAKEQYLVATAHSGYEALEIAKGKKFDLLMTDIVMPEMDGLELLQRLRELYPDIAAVVITGYGTIENAVNSLKHGAEEFIIKPFTPDELKTALSQALEKRCLMRENSQLLVLTPLLKLSKRLRSAKDLPGLLSLTVDTLAKKMQVDTAALMLLNEETQELSIRASHGSPNGMLDVARWVAQSRKPLLLPDMAQLQPRIQGKISENGIESILCLPLLAKGRVIGAIALARLAGKEPFKQSDSGLLSMLCDYIAMAIENMKLFDRVAKHEHELEVIREELERQTKVLNERSRELKSAYFEVVKTLSLTVEARDPYTRGHSERVTQIARQIASKMNLSQKEVELIDIAGRLHDIGKVVIRDEILLKPAALTPGERAEIQRHPAKAVEMLRFLTFLKDALPIIEHHHEHYDGKGYPSGLKGEQIPLGARILAVADAYDALISERPYRPAMSNMQAVEILKGNAGTQWDPMVVETFLSILEQGSAKPQDDRD
jgi:putative nucleotidyltransferase with HDIG domain